jgi:hypothetical protein
MALPKLSVPQYMVELPSTGEKISMRPYLVREEKVLLVALESKDAMQIQQAVRNLIMSCCDIKDVGKLTSFDIEFLFLNLRAKSVGEKIKIGMKCEECETMNDIEINIDDIKVSNLDVEKTFMLDQQKKIGMTLRYPTMDSLENIDLNKLDTVQGLMDLVVASVDTIFDDDNVYNADEETKEDLVDFVESFGSEQFKMIQDFFTNVPAMSYEDTFCCTNCQHENTIGLKGLQSFFT